MRVLIFYFILLFSCNNNKHSNDATSVIKPEEKKNCFHYDPDENILLTVNVLVNGKFPGVFIIDNGTVPGDKVAYSRNFARKYLLKDTSFISEARFQKDSVSNIVFGNISETIRNGNILHFLVKDSFPYDGIIGLGILKNFLIEINYQEKYFCLLPLKDLDSNSYLKYTLHTGNGVCPETLVSLFVNGKTIQHAAYLDLGMGLKNGMLLGEAATKNIFKSKIPQTGKKGIAKMSGGMTAETTLFKFDSVSLFSQLYYDFPSTITLSASGLLAGDRIWFGNDVLKSLGHIFINLETNELYLSKVKPYH